jgi:Flp pilus assembly protein TadD
MGMTRLRKRALGLAVAAGTLVFSGAALHADDERVEGLLSELAEPEADWQRIEAEIVRHWSQSGSEAMDLLLRRGRDAIEGEDYFAAIDHLSALVDHAPDFAEGWNTRATAFFMMGEYSLALADVERVLTLEPRHFGALSGLAVILESMGETALALEAHRAAYAIHPHRPEVVRAIERLERQTGGADL